MLQLKQNQMKDLPSYRNQQNLNTPFNSNYTPVNQNTAKQLLVNQAQRNLVKKPYNSEIFSFGNVQNFQLDSLLQQKSQNSYPYQLSNGQYETSFGQEHNKVNLIPSFHPKQNQNIFNNQQSNSHLNLMTPMFNHLQSTNSQSSSKQTTLPSIIRTNKNSQESYSQRKQVYNDDEYIKPIKNQQSKQSQLDYNKILTFEIKLSHKVGKLLYSKDQYLPGMLSIKTADIKYQEDAKRVGVDLICLIDKSGSMDGDKLKMVKNTLIILLDLLQSQDRLQLIAFNEDAERLTPLMCVTERNKQYFKQKIAKIYAEGDTFISSATELAFQQLKQRSYKNNVSSIFLLSDGQDAEAVQNIGHQLRTMQEVFTLHTFGFGEDHDAYMMTQISNLKNGSFYFVQDISFLDEYFADAFGGLISVIADQIEIEILQNPNIPFSDIQISKTYGSMWQKHHQAFNIKIPQLSYGQRKDYVFQLKLPKFQNRIEDHQRNVNIIQAQLKINNPVTGQTFTKSANLQLTLYNYDEEITQDKEDQDVMSQYYRVKASETIEYARQACQNGNFDLGQNLIHQLLVRIQKDQKLAQLCIPIIKDLQQAEQACKEQFYREYGQNQMYQLISNNYQQTGINSEFTNQGKQINSIVSKKSYSNSAKETLVSLVTSKKTTQSSQY